jgi:hypothetical protein
MSQSIDLLLWLAGRSGQSSPRGERRRCQAAFVCSGGLALAIKRKSGAHDLRDGHALLAGERDELGLLGGRDEQSQVDRARLLSGRIGRGGQCSLRQQTTGQGRARFLSAISGVAAVPSPAMRVTVERDHHASWPMVRPQAHDRAKALLRGTSAWRDLRHKGWTELRF